MSLRQVTLIRQGESAEPVVTFRDVSAPDDAAAKAIALRLVDGGEKDWRAFLVHEIRNAGQPACDRVLLAAKIAQPMPSLL